MTYASRLGRARISARSPEAAGICDRCGFAYSHSDLQWQFDWRGPVIQNTRILVCRRCLDTPQEQLRAIVLPADPMPVVQPRVQDYLQTETDYHTVTAPPTIDPVTGIPIPGTTTFITSDGSMRTELPLGIPDDIDINAVQPLYGKQHYGVQLQLLSVLANGSDQITVTCRVPHGLSTNDQIIVQGLSNRNACGAYSVTVTTATAFTYQTIQVIPAGALLTGSTRMVTALIGLPRGYNQIPGV